MTERYFDALWRPVLTHTRDTLDAATGNATVKRYDTSNRLVFESYPQRNIADANALLDGTTTVYDTLGRTVRVERDSELGKLSTLTAYLADFRTQVTNPRGFVTVTRGHALDDPGAAAAATIWLPEAVTVNISRDVFGKPTDITRSGAGKSLTRSYVYDAQQRLCKTREPESGATVQAYHALTGLLDWRASGLALPGAGCDQASVPTARKISFGYDTRGRLASTGYGDGSPGSTRDYTPDGLLARAQTPTNTWTYSYNNRRLLTGETLAINGSSYSFVLTINAYGHAARQGYADAPGMPGGFSVDYNPSALGQPRQVGAHASQVVWHANGNLNSYSLPNGKHHSLTLNRRGLPETWTDAGVISDFYRYDANGNLGSIQDVQGAGATSRSMGYDGLDRLGAANGVWGTGTFTYDALDNLSGSTLGARNTVATINGATNRLDALTVNGVATPLAYDANGNLTQRGSQGFVFDIGNRLLSAPGKASYTYDAHGRRVWVAYADGSTRLQVYGLSGKLLLGVHSSQGSERYFYLGDKLIAVNSSATGLRYEHTDALGSPVAHTNSAGTVTSRTQFEPYGGTASGSTPSPIGFTGHVNDADTGLTYMQQRYYDPVAGRFLSVDPVVTDADTGRSFNRYAYAANNPFRFVDPTGEDVSDLTKCQQTPGCDGIYNSAGFAGGSVLDRPSVAGVPLQSDCMSPSLACQQRRAVDREEYERQEKRQALEGGGLEAVQLLAVIVPVTIGPAVAGAGVLRKVLAAAKPTGGHPKQVMTILEDGTRVLFRKDFGNQSHSLGGPLQGAGKIDHYNIHVQSATGKTIENLHIVPDGKGSFIWWGRDGVIKP